MMSSSAASLFNPRAFLRKLQPSNNPRLVQFSQDSAMTLFNSLVLFLLLVCLSGSGFAQDTGFPPFNSFSTAGGGIDTINLANLNVHLEVPLRSLGAYGPKASVGLVMDSLVSLPPRGLPQNFRPPSPFVAQNSDQNTVQNITGIGGNCSNTTHTAHGVVDWHGTYHDTPVLRLTNCTAGSTVPGSDGWSLMGTMNGTFYANFYAVAPNGDYTTVAGGLNGATISDPHGNTTTGSATFTSDATIGNTSRGTLTDALGNTVLQGITSTPSSSVQFTYPGPNSTTATYTLAFTKKTIKEVFGCSEDTPSPSTTWLLNRVTYPDQSFMDFTYEPVYNDATAITGRIASVKLRTGATISYGYTGYGTNGMNCSDGSTAGFTKTTPDGVWKFAHSPVDHNTNISQTTVTGPDNFVDTYTFDGLYPVTESNAFTGHTICYNGNTTTCGTPPIFPTLPIRERDVFTYIAGTGKAPLTVYTYDGYSRVTDIKTYDFGGVRGGANFATDESFGYGGWTGSTCAPQTEVVQGLTVQITGLLCAHAVTTPGVSSPVSYHVNNYFGNTADLANSSELLGGVWRNTTVQYDSFGRVLNTTGPNFEYNTVSYSQCSGKMPYQYTHKASGATTLSEAVTATDCIGELAELIYDPNNQYTSINYDTDPFWRPTSVKDQAGTVTTFTYTSPTSTTVSTPITSGSVKEFVETLDTMGRKHVSQQRQGPSATQYNSVETDYDINGRVSRVTTPYAAALGGTNSSIVSTTYAYDAINRPTSITSPIGSVKSFTYTASTSAIDTLVALNSGPNGEHKQTQYEYDGLGRVKSVCEITSMTGGYACGQGTAQQGFLTTYGYSAPGNLLSITQNAGGSRTQVRSFTYENSNTGRMLTRTTPESGTVSVAYDSDSTCGTFIGSVVKTMDNGGGTTCLSYDLLHRITSKAYSGLNSANTPGVNFVYDSTTNANIKCSGGGNRNGRLVEVSTGGGAPNGVTDEGFCYDVVGNPTDVFSWINGTIWADASEYYFPTGIPQTLVFGNQLAINYGLDAMARIYSASASAGQNPLTSVSYNIANQPTQVVFGSGDQSTYNWLPAGPLHSSAFAVGSSTITDTLTWNPNGTLQQLAIVDPIHPVVGTQTCAYSYDDLNRVLTDNCGSVLNQAFSYDPFGNVTKTGSVPWPTSGGYNPSNNHYSSPAFVYDANGRLTNDTFDTMGWDIEGNMASQSGTTFVYDGLNRVATSVTTGNRNHYLYEPGGGLVATTDNTGAVLNMFFPLPMSSAVYNTAGLLDYRRYDWQGSVRVASKPNKTPYSDSAYGAFGEPYSVFGGSAQYAGLTSDISSGTEQVSASRRYHPTQGRWVSPDRIIPALFDPQSFNSYAYVLNNPLSATDPLGLFCVWDNGSFDSNDDPVSGKQGACADQGGTWFNGSPSDWNPNAGEWSSSANFTLAVDASWINPNGVGEINVPGEIVNIAGEPAIVDPSIADSTSSFLNNIPAYETRGQVIVRQARLGAPKRPKCPPSGSARGSAFTTKQQLEALSELQDTIDGLGAMLLGLGLKATAPLIVVGSCMEGGPPGCVAGAEAAPAFWLSGSGVFNAGWKMAKPAVQGVQSAINTMLPTDCEP